jgi:uncharacterized membrane protein YbhN (UPF0104 family)
MAILKVALVAGILAWLWTSDRIELRTFQKLQHGWIWAVYGFLCFLPMYFLCAIRLRLLLGALALPGSLGHSLSWTMIGSFFDVAMPSSNGGDVVKAYYVARHAGKGRRSVAIMSVMLDRVVGLLALFLFALIIALAAGSQVTGKPGLERLPAVLAVICGGTLIAFVILVSPVVERSALRKRLMARLPYHARFETLYAAFAGLRSHWGILLAMLGLSLVIQICGCAGILCLAQGLEFRSVSTGVPVPLQIAESLVVLPLAIFLNTFGVAGGWGVGEAAFGELFRVMLGVSGGVELAMVFHVVAMLSRLLGAPWVLLYRHRARVHGETVHVQEMAESLAETEGGSVNA